MWKSRTWKTQKIKRIFSPWACLDLILNETINGGSVYYQKRSSIQGDHLGEKKCGKTVSLVFLHSGREIVGGGREAKSEKESSSSPSFTPLLLSLRLVFLTERERESRHGQLDRSYKYSELSLVPKWSNYQITLLCVCRRPLNLKKYKNRGIIQVFNTDHGIHLWVPWDTWIEKRKCCR